MIPTPHIRRHYRLRQRLNFFPTLGVRPEHAFENALDVRIDWCRAFRTERKRTHCFGRVFADAGEFYQLAMIVW